MEELFPSLDPFVTSTKLLCQQLAWHLEDLELHCDKERRDKTAQRWARVFMTRVHSARVSVSFFRGPLGSFLVHFAV